MRMKRFSILLAFLFLFLSHSAFAQQDVCNQTNNLLNVAINSTTAATTRLVDNTGATQRYIVVCNYTVVLVGNTVANTLIFKQGTGASCGTGSSNITGPISAGAATTSNIVLPASALPFGKLQVGNSLCMTTTTTDLIGGNLTYVFVGPGIP